MKRYLNVPRSDQPSRDFCAKTFTGTLTAAVLTVGRVGERKGQ